MKEVLLGADIGEKGGDKTAKVYGFVNEKGETIITRVKLDEPWLCGKCGRNSKLSPSTKPCDSCDKAMEPQEVKFDIKKGKEAFTGGPQESWEKWARTLANSTNKKDVDLLVAKINVLLSQERTKSFNEGYKKGIDEEKI